MESEKDGKTEGRKDKWLDRTNKNYIPLRHTSWSKDPTITKPLKFIISENSLFEIMLIFGTAIFFIWNNKMLHRKVKHLRKNKMLHRKVKHLWKTNQQQYIKSWFSVYNCKPVLARKLQICWSDQQWQSKANLTFTTLLANSADNQVAYKTYMLLADNKLVIFFFLPYIP